MLNRNYIVLLDNIFDILFDLYVIDDYIVKVNNDNDLSINFYWSYIYL